MATSTPTHEPLTETPITSAQPGGGLCWDLELAWGRLRRGILRRFFPGRVRQMQAKRQGDCPGCCHDIIDPRDLKAYRSVCGYSFRPEDDCYAWRGRLRLARYGLAEVMAFSAIFAALAALFVALGLLVHPALYVPLVLVVGLWGFVVSFFRDPERVVPSDPDALVSPADGVVTHAEEVEAPDFPGGRAFRISIFLSVFNVHVNRVPRKGKVTACRYYPGAFLDARAADCPPRNEQFWVDFEDEQLGCPVRVKQIAGAVARRIVCWLRPGEVVEKGARFGMIKFGSRTEVLVPAEVVREVRVRVGEVVKGGSSVLLVLRSVEHSA